MHYKKQNQVSTPEKFAPDSVCDCASAPVWMTELFDGTSGNSCGDQSTPARLDAARAHMKSCASCQCIWREWSRTRTLLRDVVAPATPPALMEQVLLSCRMLPSQDAASQSALKNEIAHEELARYINSPQAEYSAAFAPPLSGLFETATVPTDLKSRILKITVQAETQRAKTPITASILRTLAPSIFTLPLWQNLSTSAYAAAREWSLPRAGRWGFALAVPALAAWVLMVSPPSNIALAPTEIAPSIAPSSLRSATSSSSFNASFFQNLLPDIANRITTSSPASKTKVVVANKPAEEKNSTEETAVVSATDVTEPVNEERPLASTITATDSASFAPRFASYAPSQPAVRPMIALPKPAGKKTPIRLVSTASTTRKTNARKKPVPMLDIARSRRASQPSVAFSNNARLIAATMLKRLPSNDERPVATMQNVEERHAAPTLIASTGFDEAFESVGRLSDDRPAEVGKAFDDYRASLMNQNNGAQFSDEDLDEQL